MGIQFDHAELKDGQSLSIISEIRSVSPPGAAASSGGNGQSLSTGLTALSNQAGGVMPGDRLGGGFSGINQNMPRKSATEETGQGKGHNASSAGDAGTAYTTPHPTGVPAVMLAGDASGKTSGTLSAAGQNIQLGSGTEIMLSLATAK
jgi:hypothetical protein